MVSNKSISTFDISVQIMILTLTGHSDVVFAVLHQHHYGHIGDVQLIYGGEKPQIYVWVEPPAYTR